MAKVGSQRLLTVVEWLRGSPIFASLKGFANGVNPRWGTRTVVVSLSTGDIIRLEDRGKKRAEVSGEPQRSGRVRIYL